jgi:tetratricopeptide (TPR) repeat protein
LGRACQKARLLRVAIAAYKAAIVVADDKADWHLRLGRVFESVNDREAARRAYETAVGQDPSATSLDRALLAAEVHRFKARREVGRFLQHNLEQIRADAKAAARAAHGRPSADAFRVFFYWGQGIGEAPAVVRRCHQELLRHHSDGDVVVLDDASAMDLAEIPPDIRRRIGADRTKLSDLLRLELLARYGGVWIERGRRGRSRRSTSPSRRRSW